MQSFRALLNKGTSVHELEAEVFISGEQFLIKTAHEEILWPINKCSIELFGSNQALILYQNQKLKFDKTLYKILKKEFFKFNPMQDLMIRTLVILLIVVGFIYQNQEAILNKIQKIIPESKIIEQGKIFKDIFAKTNCIDTPQKKALINKLKDLLHISDEITIMVVPIKDINAIAIPGKTIIFFNGLLEKIEHEDEMLAILAHELGHIKLKHHRIGMAKMILFNFVWKLLTRGQADANFVKQLLAGKYTQIHEKDADLFAKKLLSKNNISLKGARSFMKRLKEKSGVLDQLATSHPDYDDRIKTFTLNDDRPRKSLLKPKEWKLLQSFCSK